VVGNLIHVLLEIYCSLQQLKNFANRSRIDKVIAMVRVAPFFHSRRTTEDDENGQLETVSITEPLQNRQHAQNPKTITNAVNRREGYTQGGREGRSEAGRVM